MPPEVAIWKPNNFVSGEITTFMGKSARLAALPEGSPGRKAVQMIL